MIILIDGYNFIKSVSGKTFIDDHLLQSWFFRFQEYMRLRPNKIVLIFDAGPSYFQSTHQYGTLQVLYAGQNQTADDLLKIWIQKNRSYDILLVTSDREVRDWAERLLVTSMSSQDFFKIFELVLSKQTAQEECMQITLCKTKKEEPVDAMLDALMEHGSQNLAYAAIKHEPIEDKTRNRSNKKNSKADKMIMKKIDKI